VYMSDCRCGHCVGLAPKYKQVAASLKGNVKVSDIPHHTHHFLSRVHQNMDAL